MPFYRNRHAVLAEFAQTETNKQKQLSADVLVLFYELKLVKIDERWRGADEILDQNKVNNRRRSRTCIPTKSGLKP